MVEYIIMNTCMIAGIINKGIINFLNNIYLNDSYTDKDIKTIHNIMYTQEESIEKTHSTKL